MPAGTEYSRARPHIWHKKIWPLRQNTDFGDGLANVTLAGTQNDASYRGIFFRPKDDWVSYTMPVVGDWDGTSAFVFRHSWAQYGAGDQKDGTVAWQLSYWVCQDWDNPVGSKSVALQATYVYGDEGTTNYCMHCGTFQMDLTSGTFGTVGVGNTLFMELKMLTGDANHGSAVLLDNWVEYMARVTGQSDAVYAAQDKRGS